MMPHGYARTQRLASPLLLLTCCVLLILSVLLLTACGTEPTPEAESPAEPTTSPTPAPTATPESTSTPEATAAPTRVPEPPPPFYFGVDLSYVNEMDDCGAVYRENGQPRDAYELFSEHGANLVRARLWHNPDWTDYSTLPDIKRTFSRAQEAGMRTLLDFHYSDNWADPSKQAIPAAWDDLSEDELVQAVYDYTYDTLAELNQEGLMPDLVQVGNETNGGMLKESAGLDWPRDAALFKAGIQAVRDIAADTGTNPQIILHIAQPENAGWWFENATANGITDFDIIGLSYYPQWSAFSIADLGAHVAYLRQTFGKEVMVVEIAYIWTTDAVDETASNVLNQGVRGYPFTAEGQKQFMVDVTQALISNGGLGVVYWEPAWVSTECMTRWGQGSHWENATFFDFNNDNEVHEGIEFLSYDYLFPDQPVDGVIEDAYQDALMEDESGDNLDGVAHLDLLGLHVRQDDDSVYLALSTAGDILENPWGSYLIYVDTTQDDQGADVDVGRRPITVVDPYKPEFRLDITALERKGTVSLSLALNGWDGAEWQELTLTGSVASQGGAPATLELQIPKSLLGNPAAINLAVISVGRGRIHTAGDVMGSNVSAASWDEPVMLDQFALYSLQDGEG